MAEGNCSPRSQAPRPAGSAHRAEPRDPRRRWPEDPTPPSSPTVLPPGMQVPPQSPQTAHWMPWGLHTNCGCGGAAGLAWTRSQGRHSEERHGAVADLPPHTPGWLAA